MIIEGYHTCETDMTVLAADPKCPGIALGLRVSVAHIWPHFE